MDRPLSNVNRRKARRHWTTGLTCAVLLVSGCQKSSPVAQSEGDASGDAAVPQRFHAPEDIRPVAQLANHLQITEAEDNIVENPFAGLNRFPPVPHRKSTATTPPTAEREAPPLDRLRLPFRLEKTSPPENPGQPSQPALSLEPPHEFRPVTQADQPAPQPRRTGLAPMEAPLQLNPPHEASSPASAGNFALEAPPEAAPDSAKKPTAEQFLVSLEPDAPASSGSENALPQPLPAPQFDHPAEPDQREPTEDYRKPANWEETPLAENPALAPPAPSRQPTPANPASSYVGFRAEGPPSPAPVVEQPLPQQPVGGTSVVLPPHMRPLATVRQAPTAEERALLAVRGRMNSLVDRGLILAQRGAYFSARAEFIQALRLATQTLDTAQSTHRHSDALAEAIAALEEAGDFIPSGAQLEANVDLGLVISSHRTKILRETDPQDLTALTAAQRYFALAQEKLAVACGGLPEASRALVGLGRIQEHLYDTTGDNRTLIGPRSMALYQSALVVDRQNFEAANELGVLLARYGQFEDAKQALLQGVEASSRPEIWRNLASVHATLGEMDLANRAQLEAEHALQFAQAQSKLDAVRWISPEEMAAHGRGDTGLKKSPPPADAETPVAQKRPTAPWWAR